MKTKIKFLAISMLAIGALAIVGCASYTIQPVPPTSTASWGGNANQAGYVFYQPELYFLVTIAPAPAAAKADWPPVLNATPIYLPNPNKPYRVTTHNFMAKADFAFTFKDGWQLTSIDDKSDNSGVTAAVVGQMKSLVDAAMLKLGPADQPLPKTFLLHPEFDAAGVITNIVPVRYDNYLAK